MAYDIDAQQLALKALASTNRKNCDALSTIKYLLSQGLDANLSIWTDSIGNESGNGTTTLREWPYLLADRFAATYPGYKVQVFLFDATTTNLYPPLPLVISNGTGSTPPVLTIWNCAIAGSPTMFILGGRWQAAMASLSIDAAIISHGQNHVGTGVPDIEAMARGEFIAAIEQFKLFKPGVPIDAILENPRRDDDLMAPIVRAWRKIAQYRDLGLIDVYAAFMAAGRPPSLYQSTGNTFNDNVHPGQAGSNLYRDTIWTAFQAADMRTAAPRPSLFLPSPGDANLLVNGGFSQWTTSPGAPDGWTTGGAGSLAVTKDGGIYADGRQPWSVKLLGTGGPTYILQAIGSSQRQKLFGQRVTFAFRRSAGAVANTTLGTGQLNIVAHSLPGGAQSYPTRTFVSGGGWTWQAISGVYIPTDCTSLAVVLYHDTAASPDGNPIYIDQVSLSAGYLPVAAR